MDPKPTQKKSIHSMRWNTYFSAIAKSPWRKRKQARKRSRTSKLSHNRLGIWKI